MSDVNLDFIVNNNSINFTVAPNDITFTPSDIQLNISTSGLAVPSSPLNSVQYNNSSQFGGDANFTYNASTSTLSASNLVVSGEASFNANVSNIHISGGTNGYVLQTDGVGNLTWTAQTGGGGGNGAPGGSNTQIQYNDSGAFGGNAGFTFDEVTGNVNIPGNLTLGGIFVGDIANANYSNYAGNVVISSQPNITNVGTLTTLTVSGNISTTGTTTIQQAKEKVTVSSSPATGTVNFDLLTQAILLNTANATANFTLNIRGNSSVTLNTLMNSNESATLRFINTNGATGYYANVITIDGTTITPNWVVPGGTPVIGITAGKDAYDFNIIKTAANTYTVLASKTGYQ